MPPNSLVLCCPLLLLPSIFSNELALHIRWPKNWSFSINPSNEYSGLISFRIDWFSLLALQGTLQGAVWDSQESFLAPQFKSRDSSALSLVYGPTFTSIHDYWKNHSFDYTDLFNMLSRFVIAFFPRSKCLLISWLQSPCAVMLEPKKIKPVTVSIVSHLFATKWRDQMPWSSFLECWVLIRLTLLFHFHQKLFSFSSLSAIRVISSAYLRLLIFVPQSWFQLVFIQPSILHDVLCI